MNRDALINMLYAMRSQLDAALCILEAEEPDKPEKDLCPECGKELKDASSMGVKRKICKCGYMEEVNHGTDSP